MGNFNLERISMKEQKPQKQEPERVKVVPKLPNPSVFKGVKPDKDGIVRMPENGKYQ